MNPILVVLLILVAGIAAYYAGKQKQATELNHVELKLKATQAVQHNLNCLIGDLRHEVSVYKPDAQAYHTCVGLWATDLPRLIKYNKEKELFFRIGYPEHKL